MDPGQLTRHLDWLASSRLSVVPLIDLPSQDDGTDSIAITFDDGLTNFGEVAAPLLVERELLATVFIAPSHVGTYNSWDDANRDTIPRLSLLSWDEIRALASQGISFGGHGVSHIPLRGLSKSALAPEVEGCRDRIAKELGQMPETFAYPYGAFDDKSVEAVSRSFGLACTTELRVVAPGDSHFKLPRLDMYYFKDISIGTLWGTIALAPYIRLRAAGRAIRSLGRRP